MKNLMVKEFFYTIPVKFAALLGTVLFARELLEFPNFYLEIIYLVGWINLLKILDFSIPYLGRINFAENKKIRKLDILLYLILSSLINFFILDFFASYETLEVILIITCSRLLSFFNYELNITQKSYLINLPFSLSILSIILLRFNDFQIDDLIFLKIYFLLTSILYIFSIIDYQRFNNKLESHGIATLINPNYFYNLITMSIWAISSELYAIYALEVLTLESYTRVNQYIRISLIFVSVAAVISNINWNEYHNKISKIDRLFLKPMNIVIFCPIIFILIKFFARDFSLIEVSILSLYSFFSMQTLHLSQLSARFSMSNLLLISAFFELTVLFIGLNILNDHLFLLVNSLMIQVIKYFFLRRFGYVRLKENNTVD